MNRLLAASSPYLLQHAHNPVHWFEWGPDALQQAQAENKLLIVSIGYSACHWCHVMERESFEDHQVAELMNTYFIAIKVDREERPDIDQVYMDACQLITGQGGWPLNVICLPDGRPIHAGTYFPKSKWLETLHGLAVFYQDNPEKTVEYAERLVEGIRQLEPVVSAAQEKLAIREEMVEEVVEKWVGLFDPVYGGTNRAPKFPLPVIWDFMLHFHHHTCEEKSRFFTMQTLQAMALGGIYDQIGGGFARYSTDTRWKIPHFEKMLYDNAQLLAVYAQAYRINPNPGWKYRMEQTIAFMQREWLMPEGLFASALDADSEGIEGKYYVWNEEEICQVLGDEASVWLEAYAVSKAGLWEDGNSILLMDETEAAIAKKWGLDSDNFYKRKALVDERLRKFRENRVKPGLDYKCITSWNAMLVCGLAKAAQTWHRPEWLELAEKTFNALWNLQVEDEQVRRIFSRGQSTIKGTTEDYSFMAEAALTLYEHTFKIAYLNKSKTLIEWLDIHFYDSNRGYFRFADPRGEKLVVEKLDLSDDVIPSANAVVAGLMYKLSYYFDKPEWKERAVRMAMDLLPEWKRFPGSYARWAHIYLWEIQGLKQLIGSGKEAIPLLKEAQGWFLPDVIFGLAENHEVPLFQGKSTAQGEVFVCIGQVCHAPVKDLAELKSRVFGKPN